MRTFYVRPDCASGYGKGDGTSYENAWNGFKAVNWAALAGPPSTLWVRGDPARPGGFVTLHVEWSYIRSHAGDALGAEIEARPHPRRESPVAL